MHGSCQWGKWNLRLQGTQGTETDLHIRSFVICWLQAQKHSEWIIGCQLTVTSARHSRQRSWSAWFGPHTRALRRKKLYKIYVYIRFSNKTNNNNNQTYNKTNVNQSQNLFRMVQWMNEDISVGENCHSLKLYGFFPLWQFV